MSKGFVRIDKAKEQILLHNAIEAWATHCLLFNLDS